MRYIADSSGYVKEVSFGADIVCDGQVCTEYTGNVPTGYASLEAWFMEELEKLYRWKIVSGNLTLDSSAKAPSEKTPAEILASLGVADWIVESKTSGNWKYEKWNSGKYVAWNTGYKSATGTSAGSGSIGYDYYFDISLPTGLKNVENVSGQVANNPDTAPRWGTFAGWQIVSGKLRIYTAGEYNTTKVGYALKITGTWK